MPAPRGGNNQPIGKRTEKAEKTRHALELRNAGWTCVDIAKLYEVEPSTVWRWCKTALEDIPREEANSFRQRQLLQLDEMLKAHWPKAIDGASDVALWKVDRILAIMERQAKLFGLDKLAEMEAQKAAKGDVSVEAESMVSTLLAGFEHIYEQQKARESTDGDVDEFDDEATDE